MFTPENRWRLDQAAMHSGVNFEIHTMDFNYGEFFIHGGQVAAFRRFGPQLMSWLEESDET